MSGLLTTITLQVSCIRKRNRPNPHERIEGVGGPTIDGRRYYYPEDEAIRLIKAGTLKLWTSANAKSVWVVVAKHEGREYLKTEPDSYAPNNLLSLPDCP